MIYLYITIIAFNKEGIYCVIVNFYIIRKFNSISIFGASKTLFRKYLMFFKNT